MQTGGASEVQLAGGPTQPSNDAPAAQPPPHRRAPSDAPSTSASEFSTTDTSMTDAFRRDARGFEDDENFRHEHRTGARPTLTTVQEVDVLSVYPGFEHIESEQRPLMKELSENVVRYKQRAVSKIVEKFSGGGPDGKKRPWGARLRGLPLTLIPGLRWMATYNFRKYLRDDVIAGITVGIMLVPQSLSYAKLAGLSPVYGLYTGLMPMFAYALFGSSRQLSVGPVAIISQVIHSGLMEIVDPTAIGLSATAKRDAQSLYNNLAVTLALFVGIEECALGLLRLGWLIRFVSHTVVSGFTSGAAITIAFSQIKYFLGYSISSSNQIVPVLKSIFAHIDQFKWQPFLMGTLFVAFLLGMRKIARHNPRLWWCRVIAPLVTVVAGTVFMTVVKTKTISTVGKIPKGIPAPTTSHFETAGYFGKLLLTSLIVAGVGILETIGIAKALAAKNGYEINANQELFGLGIANLVGSLFSAYPCTGSFSRSAVSNDMGAKTGLAGIFTGLLILCTLLFLTPLFNNLPNTVLGAIVIAACIKLFDYSEAVHLLRTNFRDFLLWMAAFIGTIFLGIEIGVAIAVGLSLVFVIYESANPHMAILGRLPGTAVYRNVKQYPDAITHPGILIIRIDAPMYYANISYIKDRLRHYLVSSLHPPTSSESTPDLETGAAPPDWPFPKTEEEEATPGGSPVRYVILDMTPVTYVDSTAVHALKDLHQEYRQQGLHLALSNTNKRVMVTLSRTGFLQRLGPEWHFVRAHDAVQVCLSHLRADGLRTSSPPPDQPTGDAETEDGAEREPETETETELRIDERKHIEGRDGDSHIELGDQRNDQKD